jgi:hypothetical protein
MKWMALPVKKINYFSTIFRVCAGAGQVLLLRRPIIPAP